MRIRLIILWLALLAVAPAIGDESSPSLLAYELKSLQEPEIHSLARYDGQPIVMVFFQPDCNWCAKQVDAINDLNEKCGREFGVIAVGVGGTRTELRKELRRLRPDFPAYQASPRLIAEMGGVIATPITLLGDARGAFRNWTRGFVPAEDLKELVMAIDSGTCS